MVQIGASTLGLKVTLDILNSPKYLGGLVGFAILSGSGFSFSEFKWSPKFYQNNQPWVMCLIYKSKKFENSYYLAFEDGRADTYGFNNDGDFNDNVFLVTGVVNSNIVCNSLNLTCPETLDFTLENCTGKMANLSSFVTVDNCDTITTWSQSIQIGASLSVGIRNVTLNIADSSSNQASCNIFVRVKKNSCRKKLISSSWNRQY